MKILTTLILMGLFSTTCFAQQPQQTEYQIALEHARQTGQPLVIVVGLDKGQ